MRLTAYPEGGGAPRALGSKDVTWLYPQPGFVEVDARELAEIAVGLVRRGVETLGDDGHEIVSLGITNMRETAVAWRADSGVPVHSAIHWMSGQSQPQVDRWEEDGVGDLIRDLTGTANESFFFGSKVRWLLENKPEIVRQADAGNLLVGTVECWLVYALTGGAVHATDVSNASRYQLMNLRTLRFDDQLVSALKIPPHALPDIRRTDGFFGETDPATLGASIPITGVIADQQASLFGHQATSPGDVKATFGTSGVVCMNLGDEVQIEKGLVTSVAWSGKGEDTAVYEIEASAFHSGSTITWLSNFLTLADPWSLELLASSVPVALRPCVVPAFTQLGAPRWPRRTGGAVTGLQLDTAPIDVMRAAVETMAFQAYDTLRFLDRSPPLISVDGGGAVSNYLCQTLANLTGVFVSRPTNQELTSVGAARMALAGAGENGESWFPGGIGERQVFEPVNDRGYAREGYEHWSDVVDRVLGE